ncbi:MAG: FAD-dependent oxidoreductase [Rickettsiales bacterium]
MTLFLDGADISSLYAREGLSRVDERFLAALQEKAVDLYNRLCAARANPDAVSTKDESQLIIDLAPFADDFIGALFGIEKEAKALAAEHDRLAPIFSCKRLFVQRLAVKKCKAAEAEMLDGSALKSQLEGLFGEALTELSFSRYINIWMEADANDPKLDVAARYAVWATYSEKGKETHKADVLFRVPKKLDFANLVPVETEMLDGVRVAVLPDHDLRRREGFSLTDPGGNLRQAMDDANYCIWCHNQGKDSCSKGLKEKDGAFKISQTAVKLAGCPLEEKISEMNTLKATGVPIGALATVIIDNPMCAGTGHRICNDCMKSCIYQKQEPVNIPRTETRTLQDVLDLPYGFEIYSLLTRWNPLNIRRPLPKPDSGYKVLVAGLGPAGVTLSHHLLNDGHAVFAVDGLKIEPLSPDISGVTATGERVPFAPIKHVSELFEDLDKRPAQGFGGVAEYGITVRWNKNYLTVMRLLLERRAFFAMAGGVRFGGTLSHAQAFDMGFDHIALALGAGKPTIIPMPNALARGVRTASDFLMALQLSGAARKDSIANLQLRLPVAVIGGGLTGVDTATESLAYYPVQVEKFLSRYETLSREYGENAVRAGWNVEETQIADEFIVHAHAIRQERDAAAKERRDPNIIGLLKSWGGATLVYRRTLQDSPAYRLNHEEVELAMQEGIRFMEDAQPLAVEIDEHGHARGLKVSMPHHEDGGEATMHTVNAKTIFMAAGTNPNTVLQREYPESFALDGKYFKAIDIDGNAVKPEPNVSKPAVPHVLLHKEEDGRFMSFFGDLHPSYVGNVVKAMGAAKQGYPTVTASMRRKAPASALHAKEFLAGVRKELSATVKEVNRLTPNIVEVVLRAPAAARAFLPGQFYRLQNFEREAERVDDTVFAMEGLALTGASANPETGELSTIVLEMGGSSDLCARLMPGEPVILMGPTGEPTHTPGGETVMLVGGGLGNAVLFSIGKALRAAGSNVLYFAGYKKKQDRYKIKDIEAAADVIVWACDEGAFAPERAQDKAFHGNIVEAIAAYATGKLGEGAVNTMDVDRIIAIGSDRMMQAVAVARHGVLQPFLKPDHIAVGSINSPMQCMMKEICAQCLQKHVNPETGEESYVYSCFNQDQLLDRVDFPHLHERLLQNGAQEKLTKQWIRHVLKGRAAA